MSTSDDFRDLDDWKLETSFEDNPRCFVHTSYGADRASGINERAIVERWIPNPEPLGKGASGIIWLHRESSSDKKMRAVKQVSKFEMKRDNIDYKRELLALTKFSGKKFSKFEVFVDFIAWFEDEYWVYFAMEYFPMGTLHGFINGNMLEDDVRIISSQLIAGLRIMHEEGFAHRDLKPQNIFIVQKTPVWWIKIGDFGITKRSSNITALQTEIGTPLYRAPEVSGYIEDVAEDSESSVYTHAVDIWSFACVVYEMLALHVPFANPAKVVAFCNGGAFPEVPLRLRASNQGLNFVKKILVPHPQRRSKASEIEKDPWFCEAALEKAMAALNLRNDKRSNPQFNNTVVEAGANIEYIPVFQGTLAAGMAAGVGAGVPAAVGVAATAANMYNDKYYSPQVSEIGEEGDNNMVLRRPHSSYPSERHRRPPSLENREVLTSSIVDDKLEKFSWPRMELPYIHESNSDNALLSGVAPRTTTMISGGTDREILDKGYGAVPDQFWTQGRVFMMVWRHTQRARAQNYFHINETLPGEEIVNEIRRFVVIRVNHGNSLCLAIHTYGGWATLKPNLPDPENHAIIYTSNHPPTLYSYRNTNGEVYSENIFKDPIRVVPEQSGREGELDERSRINYTKVYTVEHGVRVLNIGIVDKRSMVALLGASPIKLETQRSMGHSRRNRKNP
ncbi:camk kinase protein [Rutstroemia sp. NJR-2017a WRK4]|nr:camk kinase protein [Rutstroemia sp. NJR-2017a WRK4]PQE14770.1 camk kinase protein [Rutstroemia sp. NJR-2017a WRK4]